ncbi:MAG: AMP-dependent synthetase/ligase [Rhodospirillaceae bacterium]|nr:AMP-dependent synthetase/ligase [Rhodospirillaceae bacterium]
MIESTKAIDTRQVTNLPAMFFSQAERFRDSHFLWAKHGDTYQPLTWGEVAEQVKAAAFGLKAAGVKHGDRVIIVSENRPDFFIADLAIMSIGAVAVPTYTTNTAQNHLHIINDSGARVIVVSTPQLARHVIAAAIEANNKVHIFVIDEPEKVMKSDVDVKPWAEIIAAGRGKPKPVEVDTLKREDLCCIIYTSGTGGMPKGVMLSHGNILANCYGATDLVSTLGIDDEVFLSFLPLSHSYEHMGGQFLPISLGAQIYYAERVETLPANMLECRPTIMTAVPRLYESMRMRILQGLKRQKPFQQKMFDLALRLGTKHYETPEAMTLWEKIQNVVCELLVRRKIRQRFGGRLKAMVSGGAPLNYEVGLFFIALGVPLLQGYGQTEAAPLISANPPRKVKLKTVGPPVKGVEVKIAEDGEILCRGEMVMKGYWNDPDSTMVTVDAEGWLHTGDIGHLDPEGYIEITDRKKDIIVNSGGDNVSPQRVQGVMCLEEAIGQAMVYGDKKPYLSAVIVPNEAFAKAWAEQTGASADLAALAVNPEFKSVIAKAVERSNAQLGLTEKVRKFILAPQPFTIENGQMTPSLKVRRHTIIREYKDALEALYA